MPPFVSIVVPARNEERFLSRCLESILSGDYPQDRYEILVMDGGSSDGTASIVSEVASRHPQVRLLPNPGLTFPSGVNEGVRQSRGEIIAIVGAHAEYAPDYISLCVRHLAESGADNVGGITRTRAQTETLFGRAVEAAVGHRFGSGNAAYRVSTDRVIGPVEVDTVFGGCYRRDVFDRIGLLNESLRRSSDQDFNNRLRREGGRVLMFPDIKASYFIRSRPEDLLYRNYLDGVWVTLPLREGSAVFRMRHVAPLLFVTAIAALAVIALFWFPAAWALAILLGTYAVTDIAASISASRRYSSDRVRLFLILLLVFPVRHFAYGIGSAVGLVRAAVPRGARTR